MDIFTNIVDTHIKNLRKKLGKYGNYISTIYGSGYRISDDGGDDKLKLSLKSKISLWLLVILAGFLCTLWCFDLFCL